MLALSRDQLRQQAPSIYTRDAYHRMSDRYKVAATADVVDLLEGIGLHPVRAMESRTRTPDRKPYVKHMVRFRRAEDLNAAMATEIPEVIVTNSFDGSSAYCLESGLYRVCCLNGLVCPTTGLGSLRLRHKGDDFASRVIDVSRQIVENTPTVMQTVAEWKSIILPRERQLAFAEQAHTLKPSAIRPVQLLTSRRPEDDTADDGSRSLWVTLNTTQEALIAGGIQARNSRGRRITTRAVRSVTSDLMINRGLWRMAEEYAASN